MKRTTTLLLSVLFLLLNGALNAQITQPKNTESGNTTVEEPCGFDHNHKAKLQDPVYRQQWEAHNLMMAKEVKKSFPKTVYEIPVVVHVLHKGEAIGVGTNISNAQIQSAIDNLNDVWSNNMGVPSVDMGVHFQLAVRDPNCNSTTGINRVNATTVPGYSTYGVKHSGSQGAIEEDLKDLSKWPADQYMNFWIVSEIDNNNGGCGVQGYCNLPIGIDDYNGAVMMAGTFGYDPTGTLGYVFGACGGDNGTVTHEVGHFFDLYHPFEGGDVGICPPNESDCTAEGDFVCDTPPIMNYLGYNGNTIYFNCPVGHANECGPGTIDQVMHNIMNYMSCTDRFTAGQKTRVAACLSTSRASLITSLGLTPPSGVFTAPTTACAAITSGLGLTGGYAGITEVQFSNVTKVSSSTNIDNPTNGYMDFSTSCLYVAQLQVGQTYPLKVTTWFNTQKVKAWIDYNNNGVFTDAGEQLTAGTGLTSTDGAQVTQNVTIPGTATTNTYLRMRVISDISSVSGPCHTSTYGQAEDYTVYITDNSVVADVAIISDDADNSICSGSSVTFTATPTNGGTAPTYQWQVNGVNAGTNSTTFTTSSLTDGDIVTCIMTSNLAGVTGSPATAPAITTEVITTVAPAGTAAQTFCGAATVADLVASGTTIQWYAASTGGAALLTSAALVNGTTYYATQTLNGCESATRLAVTATIGASPTADAGVPAVTICSSSSYTAAATVTGTSNLWTTSGTGTFANAAIEDAVYTPSPADITAGSVTLTVTASSGTCMDAVDNIILTLDAAPTADAGLANDFVCSGTDYTASATVPSGTILWTTSGTGTFADATIEDAVYTPSVADNTAGTVTLTLTVSQGSCVDAADDVILGFNSTPTTTPSGTAAQTFCSVSTVADLLATGTAIQWYAASTGGTALATTTSLVNGTSYFASQTENGCESAGRFEVVVTLGSSTASPTGSNAQSFCGSPTVADLVATGTAIQWYAAATGGSPLLTSDPLVNGSTYYAVQVISGCESDVRLDVVATVAGGTTPTGANAQSFCSGATVASLVANGTAIQWYAASTGGAPLALGTSLTNGVSYYATQTVGGCESSVRFAVAATITTVTAPAAAATQSFCSAGTVADLTAMGSTIQWYAASSGGAALATGAALANGVTYYASQTSGGCESTSRTAVTVSIGGSAAPTGTANQSFCTAATIANLTASGSVIQWYAASTGGAALASGASLTNGATYYATQTLAGCESATRLAVTVSITNTSAPIGSATQTFCPGATVANLSAAGTAVQWYSAATGGTALLGTAALVSGSNYYASQTVGGCASTSRLAVAVTVSSPNAPTGAATQSLCVSTTIADLVASGTAIQWYAASSGGAALSSSAAVSNATTYYASQTVGGCESASRLAVTVIVGTASPTPTGNAQQTFCGTPTVADLVATGTAIQWYLSPTGGTALATSFALSNGSNYYATQTSSTCESSTRLTVAVSINVAPTVALAALPMLCEWDSPINLTQGSPVGGVYSGVGVLNGVFDPSGMAVGDVTITYTYTNINLCAGSTQGILVIDDCVGLVEEAANAFKIYPNPANNQLFIISDADAIESVKVVDNAGRLIQVATYSDLQSEVKINLENCVDGLYTVQIKTASKVYVSKVVVKK